MSPDITAADVVGMVGAALIVVAYFLLQTGRVDSRALSFSVVNALGAAAIIFSLVFKFNASALAIEAFWLIISVFGIVRALRARSPDATDVEPKRSA